MSGSVLHAAIALQRQTQIDGFARTRRAALWMRRNGLERLRRLAARYAAGVYVFLPPAIGVGVVPAEERR
jgi:hypothetical protein